MSETHARRSIGDRMRSAMAWLTRYGLSVSVALSLALLLLYTWWHTGSLLARYIGIAIFGYMAAAGIESAIVALSLRIRQLRKAKARDGFFIGALLFVVTASALANIAEGYLTRYAQDLTLATIGGIDPIQAIVGLFATGLISVLVFALAEIIGQDIDAGITAPATPSIIVQVEPVSTVKPSLALSDMDARLVAYFQRQPKATQQQAADHLERSRAWVGQRLTALEQSGVIHRNGNGVEVIANG